MARPRLPSNLIKLRKYAKHKKHCQREDAVGNRPVALHPPENLEPHLAPLWHEIVSKLPLVAVYDSDELAIEVACRHLHASRTLTDPTDARLARTALMQALQQLGMTPAARTKIPAGDNAPKSNPYRDC